MCSSSEIADSAPTRDVRTSWGQRNYLQPKYVWLFIHSSSHFSILKSDKVSCALVALVKCFPQERFLIAVDFLDTFITFDLTAWNTVFAASEIPTTFFIGEKHSRGLADHRWKRTVFVFVKLLVMLLPFLLGFLVLLKPGKHVIF